MKVALNTITLVLTLSKTYIPSYFLAKKVVTNYESKIILVILRKASE
jgi:hypothetical protein